MGRVSSTRAQLSDLPIQLADIKGPAMLCRERMIQPCHKGWWGLRACSQNPLTSPWQHISLLIFSFTIHAFIDAFPCMFFYRISFYFMICLFAGSARAAGVGTLSRDTPGSSRLGRATSGRQTVSDTGSLDFMDEGLEQADTATSRHASDTGCPALPPSLYVSRSKASRLAYQPEAVNAGSTHDGLERMTRPPIEAPRLPGAKISPLSATRADWVSWMKGSMGVIRPPADTLQTLGARPPLFPPACLWHKPYPL